MYFRLFAAAILLSSVTWAQGHRPVCPGPAGPGTARCHAHVVTDRVGKIYATTSPTGYSPTQLRTAYNLPSATAGKGQTISIVDAYDHPNIENDLKIYSTQFGLPLCTKANGCFKKVNQTGGTSYPSKNSGWALEIALDVEIAHALCPNCKILLVEATTNSFSDLLTAEDYARTHSTITSNSWGSTEFSGETNSANDGHFNHTGHPFTFSSGDSGYGVEYPASSQYVTSVGGTTLTLNANFTRKNETVWSGSGSGCSAYEPKPSWQKDKGCIRRTATDVAADANPTTGASVYDSVSYKNSSGWFKVGGTSLASPIIASAYALAGNGANTIDGSFPYSHTSALFDVISGTNGTCSPTYLCAARSGEDGPSGNGTPKGINAF